MGISAPTYETARFGEVAVADAVATRDPETGAVSLFAVNRSLTEPVTLTVDVRALVGSAGAPHSALEVVESTSLSSPDHTWAATADDDTSVLPVLNDTAKVVDGVLTVEVPPVSWNMVRLG